MVPGLVFAVLLYWLLPDYEPHAIRGTRVSMLDRASINRRTLTLTGLMALAGLVFLTFISTVPLWLVSERGLVTDDPALGWTLAVFALAAGLGAVLGGAVAPRFGQGRTAAVSLVAAGGGFTGVLLLPVGWPQLVTAAATGLLLYVSQPLLILAAQQAVPASPTAAAGLVFGGGSGLAGVLYLVSGTAQAQVGMTTAMYGTVVLLVPAAVIAGRVLEGSRREAGPHPQPDQRDLDGSRASINGWYGAPVPNKAEVPAMDNGEVTDE